MQQVEVSSECNAREQIDEAVRRCWRERERKRKKESEAEWEKSE